MSSNWPTAKACCFALPALFTLSCVALFTVCERCGRKMLKLNNIRARVSIYVQTGPDRVLLPSTACDTHCVAMSATDASYCLLMVARTNRVTTTTTLSVRCYFGGIADACACLFV
jgi:hypothetical protein